MKCSEMKKLAESIKKQNASLIDKENKLCEMMQKYCTFHLDSVDYISDGLVVVNNDHFASVDEMIKCIQEKGSFSSYDFLNNSF